jgi:chromosome segregation ATPase
MVNQNVQEALKKFQDTKNKEYEKTQKQINELIGALNKHQSERENAITTKINELKVKINNIKEEVIWFLMIRETSEERMKQKYRTQWKATIAAEDRISELEDEMEIKGKPEELLVKQLKSCEKNMQVLTKSIKRANLRIMDIGEGEDV